MKLNHLTDTALLQETKFLVQKEKAITRKLIYHLMEIDQRRLYAELKFSSLFDYCVRGLGLSEGAAHRRISTARLMSHFSEAKHSIDQEEINLTAASLIFGYLKNNKDDHITDLLNMAKTSSSTKDFKEKLDERAFKRLQKNASDQMNKTSASQKLFKVSITLTDEEMMLLREMKAELNLNEKELLLKLIKEKKKDHEKKKFKDLKKSSTKNHVTKNHVSHGLVNRTKEKKSSNKEETKIHKKTQRSIPAKIKREVAQRAKKKCENCQSSIRLEFHHIKPFSLGGKHELDNIKLLCRNCHKRESINFFGHKNHFRCTSDMKKKKPIEI